MPAKRGGKQGGARASGDPEAAALADAVRMILGDRPDGISLQDIDRELQERGWGGDSISAAVPPADRQRVIGAALSAHGLAPTKQGGLYLPPSASSKPRTAEAPGSSEAAAQPPPGSEKPPPLEEEDEEQLDFGIDDIEEHPPSLVSSVLPAIIRSDTGQGAPELDSKQDQPEDTPRESLAGTTKDTEPAQDAPSGNVQDLPEGGGQVSTSEGGGRATAKDEEKRARKYAPIVFKPAPQEDPAGVDDGENLKGLRAVKGLDTPTNRKRDRNEEERALPEAEKQPEPSRPSVHDRLRPVTVQDRLRPAPRATGSGRIVQYVDGDAAAPAQSARHDDRRAEDHRREERREEHGHQPPARRRDASPRRPPPREVSEPPRARSPPPATWNYAEGKQLPWPLDIAEQERTYDAGAAIAARLLDPERWDKIARLSPAARAVLLRQLGSEDMSRIRSPNAWVEGVIRDAEIAEPRGPEDADYDRGCCRLGAIGSRRMDDRLRQLPKRDCVKAVFTMGVTKFRDVDDMQLWLDRTVRDMELAALPPPTEPHRPPYAGGRRSRSPASRLPPPQHSSYERLSPHPSPHPPARRSAPRWPDDEVDRRRPPPDRPPRRPRSPPRDEEYRHPAKRPHPGEHDWRREEDARRPADAGRDRRDPRRSSNGDGRGVPPPLPLRRGEAPRRAADPSWSEPPRRGAEPAPPPRAPWREERPRLEPQAYASPRREREPYERPPPSTRPPRVPVRMVAGGCTFGEPGRSALNTIDRLNEDAYAIQDGLALAVTDGLGSTVSHCQLSSSRYAQSLADASVAVMCDRIRQARDARRPFPAVLPALQHAFWHEVGGRQDGAAAICLGALDEEGSQLHVVRVGDSGFYVLRPARDAQPSSPDCMTLQSAWRPFRREGDHPNGRHSALYLASPAVAKMIGSAHAAEPDADVLTAHVAPGDVLIFGTDGLFDSVELAGDRGGPYRELVYKRAVQEQCAPEALAKELCHLAQQRAADPNAPTPYRMMIKGDPASVPDQRMDDVAVVVAYVLTRQ